VRFTPWDHRSDSSSEWRRKITDFQHLNASIVETFTKYVIWNRRLRLRTMKSWGSHRFRTSSLSPPILDFRTFLPVFFCFLSMF
jgi:hypothetical protein